VVGRREVSPHMGGEKIARGLNSSPPYHLAPVAGSPAVVELRRGNDFNGFQDRALPAMNSLVTVPVPAPSKKPRTQQPVSWED
jgi:hypothetical protein